MSLLSGVISMSMISGFIAAVALQIFLMIFIPIKIKKSSWYQNDFKKFSLSKKTFSFFILLSLALVCISILSYLTFFLVGFCVDKIFN